MHFQTLCDRISAESKALEHRMGWSFLYTPQSTFHASQQLFFIGLNPGGKAGEEYAKVASCEKGNDYLLGNWEPSKWEPGKAPLQLQVQELFRAIALKRKGGADHRVLMNESLAANYVPFRSSSWAQLSNKRPTLEFAKQLWRDILSFIQPRVIVCISAIPYNELKRVLSSKGYERSDSERQEAIGWGMATYCLTELRNDANCITLARLPHLSRFRVFGKESCRGPLRVFTSAIANALSKDTF